MVRQKILWRREHTRTNTSTNRHADGSGRSEEGDPAGCKRQYRKGYEKLRIHGSSFGRAIGKYQKT